MALRSSTCLTVEAANSKTLSLVENQQLSNESDYLVEIASHDQALSGWRWRERPREIATCGLQDSDVLIGHTSRCSSRSFLARSISTRFFAASSVLTRWNIAERASPYLLSLDSNNCSRCAHFRQAIEVHPVFRVGVRGAAGSVLLL